MNLKTKELKNWLINSVKLIISGGLILWLWSEGRIDFSVFVELGKDTRFIATIGFLWLSTHILAALRWLILLKSIGYKLHWIRSFQLHFTGLFFNTTMPGAVGGDLIKATYVFVENNHMGKSAAMTSILMDRILGLFALFLIGAIFVGAHIAEISNTPLMQPLAVFILALVPVQIIFFYLLTKRFKPSAISHWFTNSENRVVQALVKLLGTFRIFQHDKKGLMKAFALSIAVQGIQFCVFGMVAAKVAGPTIEQSAIALAYPIGSLITALPIAPGGLGVGHVAFEKLFAALGHSGGANIFNTHIMISLLVNLTGVIGYLSLRFGKPTTEKKTATEPNPATVKSIS